ADIAGSAIHRMNLYRNVESQVRRLTALRDVDIAIASSFDLRVTLTILIDNAISHLNVDAAAVLLYNPHSQMLSYAFGRGFRTSYITHSILRIGEGLPGRAALSRSLIAEPDLPNSQLFHRRELLAGEDFRCYYAVPLIAKGQVKGVLEIFHRSPLTPTPDWLEFLRTLAGQAAIAIDNTQMFDKLQRSNQELIMAYDTTLEGWSKALELRDRETEGHAQRVTELTLELARRMGVPPADLVHIRRGVLLHDIGKMGIPDQILRKTGPLTKEEWAIMRQHPKLAYDLLAPIAYLRPALDIPYCHHEMWNGKGYPRGLKGEEIPIAARIFSVVDVWDALAFDRPYRSAWPREKIIRYIRSQAGKHFDPMVVDAFLEMIAELKDRPGGGEPSG
ncbi:MAG: HD-GYP domain-containing protein, partial [Candidatus Villigracilaceae bacterium]